MPGSDEEQAGKVPEIAQQPHEPPWALAVAFGLLRFTVRPVFGGVLDFLELRRLYHKTAQRVGSVLHSNSATALGYQRSAEVGVNHSHRHQKLISLV